MEYRVIKDPAIKEFENQVNEMLKKGWDIYGNPFDSGSSICALTQVVIKKDKYTYYAVGQDTIKDFNEEGMLKPYWFFRNFCSLFSKFSEKPIWL